jgi:hypothetical protein
MLDLSTLPVAEEAVTKLMPSAEADSDSSTFAFCRAGLSSGAAALLASGLFHGSSSALGFVTDSEVCARTTFRMKPVEQ